MIGTYYTDTIRLFRTSIDEDTTTAVLIQCRILPKRVAVLNADGVLDESTYKLYMDIRPIDIGDKVEVYNVKYFVKFVYVAKSFVQSHLEVTI